MVWGLGSSLFQALRDLENPGSSSFKGMLIREPFKEISKEPKAGLATLAFQELPHFPAFRNVEQYDVAWLLDFLPDAFVTG